MSISTSTLLLRVLERDESPPRFGSLPTGSPKDTAQPNGERSVTASVRAHRARVSRAPTATYSDAAGLRSPVCSQPRGPADDLLGCASGLALARPASYADGASGLSTGWADRRRGVMNSRRTSRIRVATVALAGAWSAGTLTQVAWTTTSLRAGFGFSTAMALALLALGALVSSLPGRRLRCVMTSAWPLAAAGALLVGSALVSACVAGHQPHGNRTTRVRGGVRRGLLHWVRRRSVAVPPGIGGRRGGADCRKRSPPRRRALQQSLLLVVFETASHQILGAAARFRGLAGTPAAAGLWTIVALGLVQAVPIQWARVALRTTGVVVILATLSVATLALPAMAAYVISRSTRTRALVCSLAVLGAVTALHAQPLQLRCGSSVLVVGHRHPAWEQDGLGARFMPGPHPSTA